MRGPEAVGHWFEGLNLAELEWVLESCLKSDSFIFYRNTVCNCSARGTAGPERSLRPSKPCALTFLLVNYEGRAQKRASRLHFRAPTLRNHRYLRGLFFEITKNPNEIITFMLKIPKNQTKSTKSCVTCCFGFKHQNWAQGPPDTAPKGSKVSQTQLWNIQQRRLRGGAGGRGGALRLPFLFALVFVQLWLFIDHWLLTNADWLVIAHSHYCWY